MRLIPPIRTGKLGFSLIELMVVLLLIAIMSALIIPQMKGTHEEALLRSTGRKLINVCNLAYARSISINQIHHVRLDQKKARYFIERMAYEGDAGFAPVRDIPGGEGDLDRRVSIEIRKSTDIASDGPGQEAPVGSGDESQNKRDDVITFYPDGTAEAADIFLRDRQGFQLALRINPITARVQIIEGDR